VISKDSSYSSSESNKHVQYVNKRMNNKLLLKDSDLKLQIQNRFELPHRITFQHAGKKSNESVNKTQQYNKTEIGKHKSNKYLNSKEYENICDEVINYYFPIPTQSNTTQKFIPSHQYKSPVIFKDSKLKSNDLKILLNDPMTSLLKNLDNDLKEEKEYSLKVLNHQSETMNKRILHSAPYKRSMSEYGKYIIKDIFNST